ncbi:hypothetical protein HWV62_19091, partial [Athelia sp. TMB]
KRSGHRMQTVASDHGADTTRIGKHVVAKQLVGDANKDEDIVKRDENEQDHS